MIVLSRTIFALVLLLCLCPTLVAGAEVPMVSEAWTVNAQNHRFETYLGRPSLYLEGGIALIDGSEMRDGVFEVDIAIPEERGFSGPVWRVSDLQNYEEFYLRHHQSGNPDANQYSPVFNGLSAWQLYTGEGFAVPTEYVQNRWMTLRIVMQGGAADIFLDSDAPIMHIDLKRDPISGGLGVKSSFAAARFSNVRFTPDETVSLVGTPAPSVRPEGHLIEEWSVSAAFSSSALDGTQLDTARAAALPTTKLMIEDEGMLNLARAAGNRPNDTVLASVEINAREEQIKLLDFGFSDSVHVYLNGELLFAGDDTFVSRDYRFLGTIGLFDTVALPLKKGSNQLAIAVTEAFGGWGLMARLRDPSGVTVEP